MTSIDTKPQMGISRQAQIAEQTKPEIVISRGFLPSKERDYVKWLDEHLRREYKEVENVREDDLSLRVTFSATPAGRAASEFCLEDFHLRKFDRSSLVCDPNYRPTFKDDNFVHVLMASGNQIPPGSDIARRSPSAFRSLPRSLLPIDKQSRILTSANVIPSENIQTRTEMNLEHDGTSHPVESKDFSKRPQGSPVLHHCEVEMEPGRSLGRPATLLGRSSSLHAYAQQSRVSPDEEGSCDMSISSGLNASETLSNPSVKTSQICEYCRSFEASEVNAMVRCVRCHRQYHSSCHKPAVILDDYRTTWQCQLCYELPSLPRSIRETRLEESDHLRAKKRQRLDTLDRKSPQFISKRPSDSKVRLILPKDPSSLCISRPAGPITSHWNSNIKSIPSKRDIETSLNGGKSSVEPKEKYSNTVSTSEVVSPIEIERSKENNRISLGTPSKAFESFNTLRRWQTPQEALAMSVTGDPKINTGHISENQKLSTQKLSAQLSEENSEIPNATPPKPWFITAFGAHDPQIHQCAKDNSLPGNSAESIGSAYQKSASASSADLVNDLSTKTTSESLDSGPIFQNAVKRRIEVPTRTSARKQVMPHNQTLPEQRTPDNHPKEDAELEKVAQIGQSTGFTDHSTPKTILSPTQLPAVPTTYKEVILLALREGTQRGRTSREIFDWIREVYPEFKSQKTSDQLLSDIAAVLSAHTKKGDFTRRICGRISYWNIPSAPLEGISNDVRAVGEVTDHVIDDQTNEGNTTEVNYEARNVKSGLKVVTTKGNASLTPWDALALVPETEHQQEKYRNGDVIFIRVEGLDDESNSAAMIKEMRRLPTGDVALLVFWYYNYTQVMDSTKGKTSIRKEWPQGSSLVRTTWADVIMLGTVDRKANTEDKVYRGEKIILVDALWGTVRFRNKDDDAMAWAAVPEEGLNQIEEDSSDARVPGIPLPSSPVAETLQIESRHSRVVRRKPKHPELQPLRLENDRWRSNRKRNFGMVKIYDSPLPTRKIKSSTMTKLHSLLGIPAHFEFTLDHGNLAIKDGKEAC